MTGSGEQATGGAVATTKDGAARPASGGGPDLRGPVVPAPGGQEVLFGPADGMPLPPPEDLGYRGPTACAAAGITYRQLDYWARTGLVEPTIRSATGSGSQRLYAFRDVLVLRVVKRLLDAGVSLHQIRTAVTTLRQGSDDLTEVTLMSDGASVYACTSRDEVIDLLEGGQGVFGIALGRVWREVQGTLAELPGERADAAGNTDDTGDVDATGEAGAEGAPAAGDELAARRRTRRAG